MSDATPAPIADVVRDAIRQRLLPPGMPLVQGALAKALGVSRIPVREALQFLASEGLVVFSDDGAHVTALQPAEISELWSLRALVEPAMAEAIAEHVSPGDLARLRELVARMDTADNGDEWSDLNHAFHLELYRVARLPQYAGVARRLLTQIEPYSRVAITRPQGRDHAQAEHHEMLDALERRDGAALREVLERHSTRARALLVDYVESAAGSAEPTPHAEAARAFAARLFAAGEPSGADAAVVAEQH
jgi:DNA-binding GntR family transcriptional regulator